MWLRVTSVKLWAGEELLQSSNIGVIADLVVM